MIDVVMPKFGLTMTEGQITHWHHSVGDVLRQGDILFEVETDKVTTEVEAALDGTLTEILVPAGAVVAVGQAVARVSQGAAAPRQNAAQDADAPAARKLMADHGIKRASLTGSGREGRVMKEDVLRVIATPYARSLARDGAIDLSAVSGSGPGGRIKAVDLPQPRPDVAKLGPEVESGPDVDLGPEMAGLARPDGARLATARRVQAAKRDIPHFYLTRHVEIQSLEALRQALNAARAGRTRISLTHMLVKAAGLALAHHPQLNRLWLPQGILTLPEVGVGIVTETPAGLRIPVLNRADRLTLDDLAAACVGLLGRARAGTLVAADVSGGVMSISNVGMFGAHSLTPIINPPQAMILGVGAPSQVFRPDAAGNPALHREIVLTLAADHRVVDGAQAARFLGTMAQILETPLELMRPLHAPDNDTNGVTDGL